MVQKKDGQPLPGTSYRLLRRIGAGSCSEVFEVTGRRGQLRALKLLRAMHEGSSDVGARLVQEGRALGAEPPAHREGRGGRRDERRPSLPRHAAPLR